MRIYITIWWKTLHATAMRGTENFAKNKITSKYFFDKRNSEGNSHYKVDWLFSQHNVVLLNTTNIICNIWPLSRATYFYCPTFLDKKLSWVKFNQLNEFLSKIKHWWILFYRFLQKVKSFPSWNIWEFDLYLNILELNHHKDSHHYHHYYKSP